MRRSGSLLSSVFFCCAFACVLSCAQTTIHVPGDQPTIQAGINAAVNGDTVLVADGKYHEHIDFKGKNITVTSLHGPALTIIDGDLVAGPVVRIVTHETAAALLRGFTIQNGSNCSDVSCFGGEGGGVEIRGASPTIRENIIKSNTGSGEGGGINIAGGAPLIDSNTISQNTVYFLGGTLGAGISVSVAGGMVVQIQNNVITGNYGVGFGGGIGLNGASQTIIRGNVISGNSADRGGGISYGNGGGEVIVQNLISSNSALTGAAIEGLTVFGAPGPKLINNTIANNSSNTNAVVVADGANNTTNIENNIITTSGTESGLLCNPIYNFGTPVVKNNDSFSAQGGVSAAYAGHCTGFSGTNGNISADPLLASFSNFHPRSNSPVIDAGDNSAPVLPTLDFDGNPRIVDGHLGGTAIIDMGAYEMQPQFTMTVAQPSSVTMVNGAVSLPITFQITAAFFGTVTLSCPGAPAGVTCIFSPSSSVALTLGMPSLVTMNIITSTITPLASYALTLNASAAGISIPQTQTIGLTVNAGAGSTDLSVGATHSPDPVRVGGPLTVTFTIGNTGQDATGVTFNAFVDRAISVSALASQGSCTTGASVHCDLGTVMNSAGATVTLTVTPGFVRTISTTGIVSSDLSDSDPANDIDSATAQVRLRPRARK